MNQTEFVIGRNHGIHELAGKHAADVCVFGWRNAVVVVRQVENSLSRILEEMPVSNEMQDVDTLAESCFEGLKGASGRRMSSMPLLPATASCKSFHSSSLWIGVKP